MKNFESYLERVQTKREILNEGILSDTLIPGLIALSMIASNLESKNLDDNENILHQKLQEKISKIISDNKKKKLKEKIEEVLNSKITDEYNQPKYKDFLDNIVQNKSIEIDEKIYNLDLSDNDRQLVNKMLGGRKTYEMNVKEAAKYILNKIK